MNHTNITAAEVIDRRLVPVHVAASRASVGGDVGHSVTHGGHHAAHRKIGVFGSSRALVSNVGNTLYAGLGRIIPSTNADCSPSLPLSTLVHSVMNCACDHFIVPMTAALRDAGKSVYEPVSSMGAVIHLVPR